STMVHEIPPNTSAREVVVNSTSLEDVPLSEISDRAQSIQSLHSNMDLSGRARVWGYWDNHSLFFGFLLPETYLPFLMKELTGQTFRGSN
ncbi:hypothetical protein DOY81_009731, partial [Sarcophaga bullata]